MHRWTIQIDRLAQQGTRFTRFYVNGAVCTPTRAALLTGRYPQRFGSQLREGLRPGSLRGIPSDVPFLPDLLRQAGYRTMHIGKCRRRISEVVIDIAQEHQIAAGGRQTGALGPGTDHRHLLHLRKAL